MGIGGICLCITGGWPLLEKPTWFISMIKWCVYSLKKALGRKGKWEKQRQKESDRIEKNMKWEGKWTLPDIKNVNSENVCAGVCVWWNVWTCLCWTLKLEAWVYRNIPSVIVYNERMCLRGTACASDYVCYFIIKTLAKKTFINYVEMYGHSDLWFSGFNTLKQVSDFNTNIFFALSSDM